MRVSELTFERHGKSFTCDVEETSGNLGFVVYMLNTNGWVELSCVSVGLDNTYRPVVKPEVDLTDRFRCRGETHRPVRLPIFFDTEYPAVFCDQFPNVTGYVAGCRNCVTDVLKFISRFVQEECPQGYRGRRR